MNSVPQITQIQFQMGRINETKSIKIRKLKIISFKSIDYHSINWFSLIKLIGIFLINVLLTFIFFKLCDAFPTYFSLNFVLRKTKWVVTYGSCSRLTCHWGSQVYRRSANCGWYTFRNHTATHLNRTLEYFIKVITVN